MRALKHALKSAIAAVALGTLSIATLAACAGQSGAIAPVKTDPAAVEALVAKLTTESFKSGGKAAADIKSVADALPKAVKLTWGNLNFDAASGATVLTDVKVTPADMPTIGVNIAEVRLWDFNADFAKARLSGQRLAESGKLARRIELSKASVFGLETLVNSAISDGAEPVAPVPGGPATPPDAPDVLDQHPQGDGAPHIKNYQFTIDKAIYDDVQLRPYVEVKAAPAVSQGMDGALFSQLLGVSRSFGMDATAMVNLKAAFAMSEMGQDVSFDFNVKSAGSRGIRGADTDAGFVRDMSFNAASTGNAAANEPAMNFGGNIGLITMQDIRMDKVFDYLIKSQVPPRTATDLFSYGLFQTKDVAVKVGGADVFTLGDATFDARKFYWLIPTDLKISFNNMSFDVKQLAQLGMEAQAAENPGADTAAEKAEMERVMDLLAKNGLQKPSIDFGMGWTWNAASGDASFDLASGIDNFMHVSARYQGGFPAFKAVSDLIPDDPSKANDAAIGQVFEKATTLKQIDLNVNDEGGLAKAFAIAAAMSGSDSTGPTDPSNPMANMSPDALRAFAVGMIRGVAAQMKTQMPELEAVMTPVADFVEKGGKLHIGAKPKTPLQLSTMGTNVMTGAQSETEILKQLNLTAEHTGGAK